MPLIHKDGRLTNAHSGPRILGRGSVQIERVTTSLSRGLILLSALTACGPSAADCARERCELKSGERALLLTLANPPPPHPDRSNKYVGNPAAEALGHALYFDPEFSGNATVIDFALRRPMPYARAPKGQPINISCATCHNPARAGADFTSVPNHISIGAGWYDVNSQQTVNSAYYNLPYWNGRVDSLWAQIVAVAESFVSLGSNRVKIARRMHDVYGAQYAAVFGSEHPMPFDDTAVAAAARLEPNGQCKRIDDPAHPGTMICPPSACVEETAEGGVKTCWLRFPLEGRPGAKQGCQRGDPNEPFGDAYDCMDGTDARAVTRVYVNFAKAIAAYEYNLISKNSAFDKFMNGGPSISDTALRGAKLFVGKASCIECHSGPMLSDNQFHNIGVPQAGEAVPTEADCVAGANCDCVIGRNCLPWGFYDGLKKLQGGNTFRRDGPYSDDTTDTSRKAYYEAKLTDEMKGAWRTPSLRDIALTAPYMHDGIFRTLDEVIWHYNQGGSASGAAPANKTVQIAPLNLSWSEIAELVAFLETLTGEPLPTALVTAPAP